MASNTDFVGFACERLSGAGAISWRKMFGEYGLYLDGKFFACVCDNQLFVKITNSGKAFAPDCPTAPPYAGASDCFLIENPEDTEFLCGLAQAVVRDLPSPKKK